MGLLGTVGGGAGGFVLSGGNPLGAVGGGMAGNYVEDKLGGMFGMGGEQKQFAPMGLTPVEYGGPSIDYATARAQADARDGIVGDYSLANQDRLTGATDRARQIDAYNQAVLEAQGKAGPSVAELQMARGQEAATQQAANIAAMARGGGGAAMLAQRGAQNAAAVGNATAARDAAIMRAQEIQAARERAAGLTGQIRGMGQQDRSLSEQRAINDAKMRLEGRGQNDTRSMGLLQAQMQERAAKTASETANADRGLAAYNAAMNASAGIEQGREQRSSQREAGIIGAGGALLGSSYGSKKLGGADPDRAERGRYADDG